MVLNLSKNSLQQSLFSLSVIFFSFNCYAIETTTETAAIGAEQNSTSTYQIVQPSLKDQKNPVRVSFKSMSYDYEEFDVMTQKGRLNGLDISGERIINSEMNFLYNGFYVSGQADYNGSLSNGSAYSSEDKYTILELQGDVSYVFDQTADLIISGVAGLGRRLTVDANDPSPSDYERDITYNYLNLGLDVRFLNLDDVSVLKLNLGVNSLLSGGAQTHLSDVSSSYSDVNLKFKSGSAVYFGLTYDRKIDNNITLTTSIQYKVWNVDDSEYAVASTPRGERYFVEPKNKTSTLVLSAGLLF